MLLSNDTTLNKGFWLFIFQNNELQPATSQITDYFKLLQNIELNSRIYVTMQQLKSKMLYEVYRKSPGMNLTITSLCKSDLFKNEIEILAEKRIWTRRKDLTGVSFVIGYVLNSSFVYEKNNVSTLTKKIYFTNSILNQNIDFKQSKEVVYK